VWHAAERFDCDGQDWDDLEDHNQLCTACATDETKCSECPVHPASYYKNDVDESVEPTIVWRG